MIFENEPILGITRDGRPMTRTRAEEILANAGDFVAVESPALPEFPVGAPPPPAVMSSSAAVVVICAWHDGGLGKLKAERWAASKGFKTISHGQCWKCASALKEGTWKKLI